MRTTDKYVFFWNGIYSQWEFTPFNLDGYEYKTAEQYMMHQKALFFGDEDIAEKIMATDRPDEQKALGRKVKNFNADEWSKVCLGIVYKGNYAKFTQNEELKKELMETGDRILVEASPYDRIWGIGMGEHYEGIEDPMNWNGQNLLGWAIMMVRQHLK
jgi:ribA/ribD-fused uncharacterized protein